jgi:hypothetical protein
MKAIVIFISLFFYGSLFAQKDISNPFSLKISGGYFMYNEGHEGFMFTKGLVKQLNQHIQVSLEIGIAKGSYTKEYSGNQLPKLATLSIFAINSKLYLTPFHGAGQFFTISAGPVFNNFTFSYYHEYESYDRTGYSDTFESKEMYVFDKGSRIFIKNLGIVNDYEFRVLNTNKFHLAPYVGLYYYLDPFSFDYFTVGIRSTVIL